MAHSPPIQDMDPNIQLAEKIKTKLTATYNRTIKEILHEFIDGPLSALDNALHERAIYKVLFSMKLKIRCPNCSATCHFNSDGRGGKNSSRSLAKCSECSYKPMALNIFCPILSLATGITSDFIKSIGLKQVQKKQPSIPNGPSSGPSNTSKKRSHSSDTISCSTSSGDETEGEMIQPIRIQHSPNHQQETIPTSNNQSDTAQTTTYMAPFNWADDDSFSNDTPMEAEQPTLPPTTTPTSSENPPEPPQAQETDQTSTETSISDSLQKIIDILLSLKPSDLQTILRSLPHLGKQPPKQKSLHPIHADIQTADPLNNAAKLHPDTSSAILEAQNTNIRKTYSEAVAQSIPANRIQLAPLSTVIQTLKPHPDPLAGSWTAHQEQRYSIRRFTLSPIPRKPIREVRTQLNRLGIPSKSILDLFFFGPTSLELTVEASIFDFFLGSVIPKLNGVKIACQDLSRVAIFRHDSPPEYHAKIENAFKNRITTRILDDGAPNHLRLFLLDTLISRFPELEAESKFRSIRKLNIIPPSQRLFQPLTRMRMISPRGPNTMAPISVDTTTTAARELQRSDDSPNGQLLHRIYLAGLPKQRPSDIKRLFTESGLSRSAILNIDFLSPSTVELLILKKAKNAVTEVVNLYANMGLELIDQDPTKQITHPEDLLQLSRRLHKNIKRPGAPEAVKLYFAAWKSKVISKAKEAYQEMYPDDDLGDMDHLDYDGDDLTETITTSPKNLNDIHVETMDFERLIQDIDATEAKAVEQSKPKSTNDSVEIALGMSLDH